MRHSVTICPDGRALSYLVLGAEEDPLVVVLDGPGSRGLAQAAAPIAAELGIRLAAPDRPGFGDSTPAPRLGIADWPADHAALLDALGAERTGVLAQSGGTPFALAAAAALPECVSALALIGALAPLAEPTAHSRWLAARLGDAPVEVVPEAATFGMLSIYADALRFAAAAVPR